MEIVRWRDPFGELDSIHERMNRLFEEAFAPSRSREETWAGTWEPAVDIYESDDAIVVTAELPGVEKDQVSVEVKDGVLTLRGERKFERDVKEESYHRVERAYGTFHRSFTVPPGVDPEKVQASMKDGVLAIRLEKREEAKPKQIAVL